MTPQRDNFANTVLARLPSPKDDSEARSSAAPDHAAGSSSSAIAPSPQGIASATLLLSVLHHVREFDPEMPAQTLAALLEIASSSEPITQQQLRKKLNLASSSIARISARLGEWRSEDGKPGLGFVISMADPTDRRVRRLGLTEKGAIFMEQIASTVAAGSSANSSNPRSAK